MKFCVVVNYYLVSLSLKFHEDPCINVRTPVVNARAHVLSRVRAFTTAMDQTNVSIVCKYLANESSDLHEILCGGQLLSWELNF